MCFAARYVQLVASLESRVLLLLLCAEPDSNLHVFMNRRITGRWDGRRGGRPVLVTVTLRQHRFRSCKKKITIPPVPSALDSSSVLLSSSLPLRPKSPWPPQHVRCSSNCGVQVQRSQSHRNHHQADYSLCRVLCLRLTWLDDEYSQMRQNSPQFMIWFHCRPRV